MLQASAPQKRHSPGLLPRSSPAGFCAPTAFAAKSPRPPSTARRLVVRENHGDCPLVVEVAGLLFASIRICRSAAVSGNNSVGPAGIWFIFSR